MKNVPFTRFFMNEIQKPHSFLNFIINILEQKMAEAIYPPFFYQGQLILQKQDNLGQVWLSGLHFAKNIPLLRQYSITCVISAADLGFDFPSSITNHKFNLRDNQEQQIRNVLYPAIRLIEQERKKGNVLIHCAAGVSRSTSLLIAYMMHKYEADLHACYAHILKKRPCVRPNPGFVKQLKQFAGDLGVKDKTLNIA